MFAQRGPAFSHADSLSTCHIENTFFFFARLGGVLLHGANQTGIVGFKIIYNGMQIIINGMKDFSLCLFTGGCSCKIYILRMLRFFGSLAAVNQQSTLLYFVGNRLLLH